eukprot:gene13478-9286_t
MLVNGMRKRYPQQHNTKQERHTNEYRRSEGEAEKHQRNHCCVFLKAKKDKKGDTNNNNKLKEKAKKKKKKEKRKGVQSKGKRHTDARKKDEIIVAAFFFLSFSRPLFQLCNPENIYIYIYIYTNKNQANTSRLTFFFFTHPHKIQDFRSDAPLANKQTKKTHVTSTTGGVCALFSFFSCWQFLPIRSNNNTVSVSFFFFQIYIFFSFVLYFCVALPPLIESARYHSSALSGLLCTALCGAFPPFLNYFFNPLSLFYYYPPPSFFFSFFGLLVFVPDTADSPSRMMRALLEEARAPTLDETLPAYRPMRAAIACREARRQRATPTLEGEGRNPRACPSCAGADGIQGETAAAAMMMMMKKKKKTTRASGIFRVFTVGEATRRKVAAAKERHEQQKMMMMEKKESAAAGDVRRQTGSNALEGGMKAHAGNPALIRRALPVPVRAAGQCDEAKTKKHSSPHQRHGPGRGRGEAAPQADRITEEKEAAAQCRQGRHTRRSAAPKRKRRGEGTAAQQARLGDQTGSPAAPCTPTGLQRGGMTAPHPVSAAFQQHRILHQGAPSMEKWLECRSPLAFKGEKTTERTTGTAVQALSAETASPPAPPRIKCCRTAAVDASATTPPPSLPLHRIPKDPHDNEERGSLTRGEAEATAEPEANVRSNTPQAPPPPPPAAAPAGPPSGAETSAGASGAAPLPHTAARSEESSTAPAAPPSPRDGDRTGGYHIIAQTAAGARISLPAALRSEAVDDAGNGWCGRGGRFPRHPHAGAPQNTSRVFLVPTSHPNAAVAIPSPCCAAGAHRSQSFGSTPLMDPLLRITREAPSGEMREEKEEVVAALCGSGGGGSPPPSHSHQERAEKVDEAVSDSGPAHQLAARIRSQADQGIAVAFVSLSPSPATPTGDIEERYNTARRMTGSGLHSLPASASSSSAPQRVVMCPSAAGTRTSAEPNRPSPNPEPVGEASAIAGTRAESALGEGHCCGGGGRVGLKSASGDLLQLSHPLSATTGVDSTALASPTTVMAVAAAAGADAVRLVHVTDEEGSGSGGGGAGGWMRPSFDLVPLDVSKEICGGGERVRRTHGLSSASGGWRRRRRRGGGGASWVSSPPPPPPPTHWRDTAATAERSPSSGTPHSPAFSEATTFLCPVLMAEAETGRPEFVSDGAAALGVTASPCSTVSQPLVLFAADAFHTQTNAGGRRLGAPHHGQRAEEKQGRAPPQKGGGSGEGSAAAAVVGGGGGSCLYMVVPAPPFHGHQRDKPARTLRPKEEDAPPAQGLPNEWRRGGDKEDADDSRAAALVHPPGLDPAGTSTPHQPPPLKSRRADSTGHRLRSVAPRSLSPPPLALSTCSSASCGSGSRPLAPQWPTNGNPAGARPTHQAQGKDGQRQEEAPAGMTTREGGAGVTADNGTTPQRLSTPPSPSPPPHRNGGLDVDGGVGCGRRHAASLSSSTATTSRRNQRSTPGPQAPPTEANDNAQVASAGGPPSAATTASSSAVEEEGEEGESTRGPFLRPMLEGLIVRQRHCHDSGGEAVSRSEEREGPPQPYTARGRDSAPSSSDAPGLILPWGGPTSGARRGPEAAAGAPSAADKTPRHQWPAQAVPWGAGGAAAGTAPFLMAANGALLWAPPPPPAAAAHQEAENSRSRHRTGDRPPLVLHRSGIVRRRRQVPSTAGRRSRVAGRAAAPSIGASSYSPPPSRRGGGTQHNSSWFGVSWITTSRASSASRHHHRPHSHTQGVAIAGAAVRAGNPAHGFLLCEGQRDDLAKTPLMSASSSPTFPLRGLVEEGRPAPAPADVLLLPSASLFFFLNFNIISLFQHSHPRPVHQNANAANK